MSGKCFKDTCYCTHEAPCERGWIWIEEYVENKKVVKGNTIITSTKHTAVKPCPTCDPERSEIFRTSRSPEELHRRLQERSTFKRESAYESRESDRTRTL